MERYCSTGQSPQWAVAPTEEEEYYGTTVVYAVRRWPKRPYATHDGISLLTNSFSAFDCLEGKPNLSTYIYRNTMQPQLEPRTSTV